MGFLLIIHRTGSNFSYLYTLKIEQVAPQEVTNIIEGFLSLGIIVAIHRNFNWPQLVITILAKVTLIHPHKALSPQIPIAFSIRLT